MRPPILFLTIAFGAGLVLGEGGRGTGDGYVMVPVLSVAAVLARRTPLGSATGVMAVAGLLWGGAAVRERGATCAGQWSRDARSGMRDAWTRGAIVRLLDPASDSGGLVDADVVGGARCGGTLRVRWPEQLAARGRGGATRGGAGGGGGGGRGAGGGGRG